MLSSCLLATPGPLILCHYMTPHAFTELTRWIANITIVDIFVYLTRFHVGMATINEKCSAGKSFTHVRIPSEKFHGVELEGTS